MYIVLDPIILIVTSSARVYDLTVTDGKINSSAPSGAGWGSDWDDSSTFGAKFCCTFTLAIVNRW